MYDHIIFDVDGTLVDTGAASLYSLQRILEEELGKVIHIEDLQFAIGIPGKNTLAHLGVKEIDRVLSNWVSYMKDYQNEIFLFDGILELLSKISENGLKTGIVTSRTKYELISDALLNSISSHFSYFICADDTEKHKPHPAPLIKLLELSDKHASEVLYIGDTVYDFCCAKDAGVDFALALWGAKGEIDFKPKYKLKTPLDLLPLLNL